MDQRLLPFRHLWEDELDNHVLMPEMDKYGQIQDYLVYTSLGEPVWLIDEHEFQQNPKRIPQGDPEVRRMIIDHMIEAGMRVIQKDERDEWLFNALLAQEILEYESHPDDYVLVAEYSDAGNVKYYDLLVNIQTGVSYRYESSALKAALYDHVLKAGIRVISYEEYREMRKKGFPEAPKGPPWLSARTAKTG